ncbi:Inner spore coat protein H [Pelotomaculum sp. FP]|uniref:CotH kinase family protein n=1 Tax=Pelotomaculum sp. FP TaxID=261474 RepID=UPI00106629CB|nr:CotH kinase family protein [Pelotomaculum sp. FP]TEB10415.1 Inner spore coat protein H [Pelotomaculum sp. FP]
MIEGKRINLIIAIAMVIAVMFTTALILFPGMLSTSAATEPEYVSKVFNKDEVTQINIDIKQEDFDWILENATQEEYRSCDITVNGATFYNAGIRPKGNSSLRTVAGNENTDRYSFKIEFDTYIAGQTCFGLNKLALNNIIMDKTYMKEYIAYDLFDSMGVVTPKYAYANITVNGEPWGLYLAVEVMEESFVERNYGSTEGRLYRPEGAGADLKWTGDSASNYSGIRNNAAYDVTDSDFDKVITMIYNLNNGTDLEQYLDVDSILRYFAVNTFLVNFDSYTGNMKHNYYLYEENGVFTILPWDFNLAFAGHEINNAEAAINHPIDTPVTSSLSERPLLGKLLEVPEYKELYHKYLSEVVSSYFDSGVFENNVQKVDALIGDYVKNDATAFYTCEQYENSLPVFLEFARQRAASITAQLAGTLPATSSQQGDNTSKQNTTAAGIDLSALGGMGGGVRGNGAGGEGRNNQGIPAEQNNNREPQPANGGGPPGDRNVQNQENMAEIMEIMQETENGELSAEQIARLKELGLDDDRIERMKNMPAGMQQPGRANARPGAAPGNEGMNPFGNRGTSNQMSPVQIGYISVSAAVILLGLLFAWKFRKRKYSS